jgi:hypothetical protein
MINGYPFRTTPAQLHRLPRCGARLRRNVAQVGNPGWEILEQASRLPGWPAKKDWLYGLLDAVIKPAHERQKPVDEGND